ncbi:uncharacterized protein LOC132795715 [Drosophila nasuta]|uniref:uncharacterized protein LOC132795715 n=1 Tax=Drosophila nasuta TaxID=42062 RepID=UPI00295EDEB1|nr:uncharacterized protein LOC132795715 [Drosophila nasuta]
MKQNNKMTMQQQRNNIKLPTFDKDNDNDADGDSKVSLRKGIERKLKYLSESNRFTPSATRAIRRRGQRSSDDGGSIGAGFNRGRQALMLDKHSSEMKLKEVETKLPRLKVPTIPNFVQSPRRNGLSPRDFLAENDEDDADDEETTLRGALQDEFEKHLAMGGHGINRRNRSHMSIKHMHKPTYSCSSCGARFHIKSLLGAHRRTHDDDFKVRFRARRPRDSNTAISPPPARATSKQCKFCDRYFDLERALHIHQLCHCNKITPQQRRKLGYTDLAHEKKNAPLPNFQRMPRGSLPEHTTPDPNMPYVALGPAALKMIEQEQQMKSKRRSMKYTVKVAGPMGRWR